MIAAAAAAALLTSLTGVVDHQMAVTCRVVDANGLLLARPAQLYTGRHDRRFALSGKLFLDMRYKALAGTVAVTVVEVPHAPWTFGEKVVASERVFDISNHLLPPFLSLDSVVPGAQLKCS